MLHNICEEHGDNFIEEHIDRQFNIQPPRQAFPEHGEPEGADVRAAIMSYFSRREE